MNKSRTNTILGRLTTLLAFLLAAFVVTGSAAQEVADIDPTIAEDIPDDANRVILMADPNIPKEPRMDTDRLFKNAVTELTERGYEIGTVSYDNHTMTTTPRMIREDLWVKLEINVREGKPGEGEQLVALAKWAPSTMINNVVWMDAAWTSSDTQLAKDSKSAFVELIDALEEVQHSVMYTESYLGATEKETS